MIDPNLKGNVALITGANHGIGAATAKAFAKQGASVFINYFRRPLEPDFADAGKGEPGQAFYRVRQTRTAEEVVKEIRADGGDTPSGTREFSQNRQSGPYLTIEQILSLKLPSRVPRVMPLRPAEKI